MRNAWLIAALLAAGTACAQTAPGDALAQGFVTPPDSAKPRTWWHWTNGNVTEEGITKDLEWMKRVGIGGFQLVDVASGNGQEVEQKINFATPEWYHAVRHSAEDAKRLGLEMSIFSCAGWSEAGGPWVKPEQAMKKLVWSETEVAGGEEFAEKLAQPPSNEGPVRDSGAGARPDAPHFYRGQRRGCLSHTRRGGGDGVAASEGDDERRADRTMRGVDGRQPEHGGDDCARRRMGPGVAAVRVCAAVYGAGACRWEPGRHSGGAHSGERRWRELPRDCGDAGAAGISRRDAFGRLRFRR